MKKSMIILLAAAFSFSACFMINAAFSRNSAVSSGVYSQRKTLVIDAGHGGVDAGTNAADGTLEKDINLDIALKLYDFATLSGIKAVEVRNSDAEYYPLGIDRSRSDLYNRFDFINSIDNSFLVSIHQNHFEDTSQWGMQVFYSPDDNGSKRLADGISAMNRSFLQTDNKRENKQSDDSYYLLYNAKVPSVMVECGFMSNIEENEKLKSDDYQNKLAYIITLGICDYLENGDV